MFTRAHPLVHSALLLRLPFSQSSFLSGPLVCRSPANVGSPPHITGASGAFSWRLFLGAFFHVALDGLSLLLSFAFFCCLLLPLAFCLPPLSSPFGRLFRPFDSTCFPSPTLFSSRFCFLRSRLVRLWNSQGEEGMEGWRLGGWRRLGRLFCAP